MSPDLDPRPWPGRRGPWQRLRASRAWRLPATALGFALFGLGSVVLSLTLLPLLLLAPLPEARRRRAARGVIAAVFRGYIATLRGLGLLTHEFIDVEALRTPGQLIIANHPTLLDTVFLIALCGHANCVVKGSLWRNPFMTFPIRAARYLRNDQPDLYPACVDALRRGESLIIFPEGTRSDPGRPLQLQRGFANIALAAGAAPTPVVIDCLPVTLLKAQKWYRIAAQPSHYRIRVLPPLALAPYQGEDLMQSTASRRLTRAATALFARELATVQGAGPPHGAK